MQKLKKPVSIILSILMVVSMFIAVPITASAAVGDFVPESEFLTFTAVENNSSVTLNVSTGSNLQYNINNSDWQSYTVGSLIALEKGDSVSFRGKDTTFDEYNHHVSIGGKVACSGNVMSLRLDDNGKSQGLSYDCFNNMFMDCTGLTAAPELPETNLAEGCYYCMFSGCTSLTTAPELPATTLADYCYYGMFADCERLTTAPVLPATMLAPNCYSSMFYGCTSLTTAPELWATSLELYCYNGMFAYCTSLTTAPELPATTLVEDCYSGMFYGCERLTTAPELPATTLAKTCYCYMFEGCTSLTTAPELPATTLAPSCYDSMFAGCSSIKLSETKTAEYSIPYSVPSGGNGTTADYALDNMFAETGGTFKGTPAINTTYYLYREVPKYTVTWKNGDTTLETDTDVAEGTTPTYDGATPTKAADGDHMYVFSGWTPELAPVTEDVTYTATFTSSADLVEITDHETDLGDLGIDEVMSEWGRSMTAQAALTLAQYMSAQNDGAKCAVLYEVVDDYELQYAMSDGTTGSYTSFYSYTLNDFLPDYKVYYLPLNLNPETIELNLNQDNATVNWDDSTGEYGYWAIDAIYDGKRLTLLGENNEQAAGTYEWADMKGAGIPEIIDAETYERIVRFINGSCTVTVDEDVVTVSGTFTGVDRNTYVVTVTHEAPYYTITDESVNGAVTAGVNGADVTRAKAGKTVLLNVAPADGYRFKSITVSAPKDEVEHFSDLVALMGDAVFDGNEDYNCAGYSCKVENGKFVVYNGTTFVTELSESNMTEFDPDTDYVQAKSDTADWIFFIEDGKLNGISVLKGLNDYIYKSAYDSESTGSLPLAERTLTTVAEGSQYSFTMPAKNVTVKAEFEAIPTYTVTWKNGDTVLETDTDVAEGTTPTYDGETPYKADGANCIYTFSGWTPEVSAVTGDATYTAQFTESAKPAVIKDCNNKFSDFRLYANVPFLAGWDNLNDMLTGAIGVPTYSDSNTYFPLMDTKGYSYKLYDQTGTEIPFEISDSQSEPGSGYGFSDDVTVYTNVINFTRPAGCTAIYIVATAPAPAPAKLTLNVGENGKVVMDNGTFGNATDASNIVEVRAPINVADGSKVFIVDGHSANLVEGGSINIAAGGEVSLYPSADNTGKITAIPDEGYICTGWYNGDTRYTTKDTIDYQAISEDMTLTAKFAPKLFTGHSVTLGGDVGVNFFLNPEVLNTYSGTKTVKFTVDGKETTVDVPTTATDNGYMVTCNVVAAQMAHKIKAVVYVNGTALNQTDSYSVQDYAEAVYAKPGDYTTSDKADALKDLAKAMLNYGAEAQTVFANALIEHPDRADKKVGQTSYDGVTAALVKDKINGTASDLNKVATQLNAKYFTNSLIYMQNNTLRVYFTPKTYPADMPNAGAYDGNQSNYYYYKDKAGIAAAELDDQQEFTVGNVKFYYSPLNYVVNVLSSNMSPAQMNLAKALFLYNQKANAFFDEPAPVHTHTPGEAVQENVVPASCTAAGSYDEVVYCSECHEELSRETKTIDMLAHTIVAVAEVPATTEADGVAAHYECSVCHKLFSDAEGNNETTAAELVIPMLKILVLDDVNEDTTVENGYIVTGTLKGDYKISIADGATVTLKDVNITCLSNDKATVNFAGITPLGDATILLEGANTVKGGYENYPGVFVPVGKTLTIDGTGSLNASSNGYGCGIGGGCVIDAGNIVINSGNIVINGGTIIATGGNYAAGIGSGSKSSCGNITITGGTVTATGGNYAAGIGSGAFSGASCGNITIADTVTQVTATKGPPISNSIGKGFGGTCGTISIADPSKVTQN